MRKKMAYLLDRLGILMSCASNIFSRRLKSFLTWYNKNSNSHIDSHIDSSYSTYSCLDEKQMYRHFIYILILDLLVLIFILGVTYYER